MADTTPKMLWAPRAWLPAGWADDVLLEIGGDGRWSAVTPGVHTPPATAERVAGPLLPGLVNAHSHAFQRAFAGMAERRESTSDDFWSWRDRMYAVALRIGPQALRAVAAQLYLELLRGGYTHVCEFHYLHHAPNGEPYPDRHALGWALADAAADVGLGLTLMPAVYERAGFAQPHLRPDQRRFANGADAVIDQARAIEAARRPLLRAGLVLHSLRAATADSVRRLANLADGFDGPIHIHVAEQTAEVDDCLAATGARPIEWLLREGLLDGRWHLVHATHTVPEEIAGVARSGAGVVLCPSTEANLGDGLADLRGWLAAGVPLSLGSDSHVVRDWREELRWLDYGQRLTLRQRNVAAAPGEQPATAARLWQRVQHGSAAAAGEPAWGLVPGARADALVPDPHDEALCGIPAAHTLDAMVFSGPGRPFAEVMVAGRWLIRGGRHAADGSIARDFESAMAQLWSPGD
jgi:formimidoylglutamate deiminase